MASPADGLQEPYLAILDLYKYEKPKLYNKTIIGLPINDSYDLTIFIWTYSFQELEDAVSTFGFKLEFLIVTTIYGLHVTTEVKNTIISYPSIT